MIELDNKEFNNKEFQKEFPTENHFFNIEGFIRTLTEEPTYKPKKLSQQFVLVTTGGSSRAYIYDTKAQSWKSVVIA